MTPLPEAVKALLGLIICPVSTVLVPILLKKFAQLFDKLPDSKCL